MKIKKNLKERFLDLEFEVRESKDLTCKEMEKLMIKVSRENHTDNDCFMCAMLSHGKEGTIYGYDGPIEIQKLKAPFKGDNCKSLAGKPKIFFIQACRGNDVDAGCMGGRESATMENMIRIPVEADFLLAYSVVPDHVSFRNTALGSWFVQAINEVFKENGKKLDLMTLMTEVNYLVAHEFEKEDTQEKQMPCITSMLTKAVYFRPKN